MILQIIDISFYSASNFLFETFNKIFIPVYSSLRKLVNKDRTKQK